MNTLLLIVLFVPKALPWDSALGNPLVDEMSPLHKEFQELHALE
jgi:hypothetical protein